ncbi:MAG: hypothetical protein ACREX8_01825, partial [Gammaproteobacteria bacterium]
MRTPVTLLAFFVGLIVLFGVAVSLGEVVGGRVPGIPGGGYGSDENGSDGGDEHPPEDDDKLGGLSISDQGYVLWPVVTRFPAGETAEFRFTIFTVDRTPVTDFAIDRDRRMRLIVVRRDMTEYQHLRGT